MELRGFIREPDEDPMTEDRLPLAELLAKAGDGDFLRSVAESRGAADSWRRMLTG